MKEIVALILVILGMALFATACSQYTCPAYAKNSEKDQLSKEVKVIKKI